MNTDWMKKSEFNNFILIDPLLFVATVVAYITSPQ